jgi:hypothetical protein
VHLVGVYPGDGCGIGDEPGCVVPANATLAFRFDRFLNPASVNRQAFRIYTGDVETSPSPPTYHVTYDPVERVVELTPPAGAALAAGSLYELELLVAAAPGDSGIRAFDGAVLEEADLPLRGVFLTSASEPPPPAESNDYDCERVMPIFAQSCSGAACHQRGDNVVDGKPVADAPHGLWLDNARNFTRSAVDRVARQTDVGDSSGGVPAERPARFGVRMPLVDPKNPANSYLVYKLLRNPANFEPCPADSTLEACRDAAAGDASAHPLVPLAEGQALAPDAAELDRLREWFVRGAPMPAPSASSGSQLYLQGLRAVSGFIAAGARCEP